MCWKMGEAQFHTNRLPSSQNLQAPGVPSVEALPILTQTALLTRAGSPLQYAKVTVLSNHLLREYWRRQGLHDLGSWHLGTHTRKRSSALHVMHGLGRGDSRTATCYRLNPTSLCAAK